MIVSEWYLAQQFGINALYCNMGEDMQRKYYLSTNNHIVLDTNMVILDDPYTTLSIPFIYMDEYLGELRLKFVKKEGSAVEISTFSDEKVLTIQCVNFKEAAGRFTKKPIDIGDVNGKKCKMHIWSSLDGDEACTRRVEYTIFMEK